MRHWLILVFAGWLAGGGVAAAQATPCRDCAELERALAEAEAAAAATRARIAELDKQISSQNSLLQAGEANRAAIQEQVNAGRGDADSAARLKAYGERLARIRTEVAGLIKERLGLQPQLEAQTRRVELFRKALEACKLQPCPPPTDAGGGSNGGGGAGATPGTLEIPVLPDRDAIPDCEPCKPNADAIEKWEKEISDARAEVEATERRVEELGIEVRRLEAQEQAVREQMKNGSTRELAAELDRIGRAKFRVGSAHWVAREILEVERLELKALHEQGPKLEDALDRCNESCPVPDPPTGCDGGGPGPCSGILQDKRVLGAIGGGLVIGGLVLSGGDPAPPVMMPSPNPVSAPTVAPTPTVMPPAAPDPPMPPPRITADGRYRCVGFTVVNDEGRHNSTIALGEQLTGDFDVREGSITIRHSAPFVDIVGAQFDIATGRFSGTAVGRVAGSPNVGVRADGTVDTATGRIVFNYSMGTGGELPGGRPIIYGITLQKQ